MSAAARRVLMIAPYYPPRPRVGAQRPFKFARHLPAYGYQPAVVCLSHEGPAAHDASVPQLALFAPPDAASRTGGARHSQPARRGALSARVDARIPIDSWWPLLMAQLPRVLRFARAHAPDVIWSTADPWSAHALALAVARALKRPWLADFRDPWTLCDVRQRARPAWVRALDAQAEQRYLRSADTVTFTAPRTTEQYRAAHPQLAARFHTLENSFDLSLYAGASAPAASAEPGLPLTLTFLGRFRPLSGAARIAEVLQVLRQRHPEHSAVRVRSVGGLDARDQAHARDLGVADLFEALDAVPLEHALALVQGGDLALLSTEPGRGQIIPAKLFDYLAAGRPVFGLADNPDSAAILRATGLGLQYGRDQTSAAAEMLAACVAAKRARQPLPLGKEVARERVLEYSSERTSARLAALLDRLTCAGSSREDPLASPAPIPRPSGGRCA